MSVDLFAGLPVKDIGAASVWYERFFGMAPAFLPNDVEAVWELAEHRYIFIEESVERAGHALITVFVEDLDAVTGGITERGIEPAKRETYENGVRKITYRDPDGNEIGYGGGPTETA
ncbi:VOC family protein [Streptomyces sp. SID13031]|uniref:VOC family protein n=1 Tax=Streptomyces sp. SID13031 TaxID=2706046 RepID=UPI0013CC22D9|nr:VOC family protein [Streptomyces sp. SID13031]NEA35751.1 VOC family protein [Streptomyces sp. SID13031]